MARGRRPDVNYWKRKGGGYFVTVKGRQVELALGPHDKPSGPTYLAALQKYAAVMAMENGKGTDDYLVSSCLNQYRIHLASTRKTESPGIFDSMCRRFNDKFGKMRVSALIAGDVQDWLDEQSTWNDTSKRHGGQLILGAIAFAKKRGYIRTDPIKGGIDLPTAVCRGREARMPRTLCELLIDTAYTYPKCNRAFGDFLTILYRTGCRPVEVRKAEAWNVTKNRIVYRWNATKGYMHKNAKRTQRDRVIYLDDESAEIVNRNALAYPSGPVMRTPRRKAWRRGGLNEKWGWLCSRPDVLDYSRAHDIPIESRRVYGERIEAADLQMYNFRHTFISDYVDETGDIWTAARLCGTSVAMIERRYGHPDDDKIHAKIRAYHHKSI